MNKPTKKDRNSLPPREQTRGKDPFYNSSLWRTFRAAHKIRQRNKDLLSARLIYKDNTKITLREYNDWINNDSPMCVHCLTKGRIEPAKVLDHIIPRSQGGADTMYDNLQWLCTTHHQIKSQSERQ